MLPLFLFKCTNDCASVNVTDSVIQGGQVANKHFHHKKSSCGNV